MEIQIKTSSLYSCDLFFHAYLTDFPDISKSSTDNAHILVICGLEKVSVQASYKSPTLLIMDKANEQKLVSLGGIFITDQIECPIERFKMFSDASLASSWSEISKIELKLPNDINEAQLSVNRGTPFRSKVYILSQSTGYNPNVLENAIGWKPA